MGRCTTTHTSDHNWCNKGANYLLRKIVCASSPEQVIEVKDDTINITTKMMFWTQVEPMKLNEEYEHDDYCVKHKNFSTYKDGTIINEKTPNAPSKLKPQIVTRDIVDKELLMTIKCGDVVCKRWFKRLQKEVV